MYRRSPGNNLHTNLDICREVQRYRRHRRRLCLSFNQSKVWRRSEPPQATPRLLQMPRPVSLHTLLQRDSLCEEKLDIRLRKSRLALQLASSLHRLYPGPWIQQNWNAQTVQLINRQNGDAGPGEMDRLCVPCNFVRNWKTTNPVWQEFDAQNDLSKDYPGFFLSFAQLLVDISEGGSEDYHLSPNEDRYDTLLSKAEETVRNKFLQWYGEAIRGCLHYALDYDIEEGHTKNPRERARVVIQKKIVDNLQKNLHFWETEWRKHLRSPAFGRDAEIPPSSGTAVERTRLPQKVAALKFGKLFPPSPSPENATAKRAFFKLFADEDDKYVER